MASSRSFGSSRPWKMKVSSQVSKKGARCGSIPSAKPMRSSADGSGLGGSGRGRVGVAAHRGSVARCTSTSLTSRRRNGNDRREDHGRRAPFDSVAAEVDSVGGVEEEFLFEGTATQFGLRGGSAYSTDGRWDAEPMKEAPFRSRMLVVRPGDPDACNGTVIVTWNNVSAGQDNFTVGLAAARAGRRRVRARRRHDAERRGRGHGRNRAAGGVPGDRVPARAGAARPRPRALRDTRAPR